MAITDAVVPVAGLGTRLLPATRSQPKEMLPVVDKPVVQYVVEELVAAGIQRVLFVTGRRKRAIEDHFDADPELGSGPLIDGVELFYTRQSRPAGLGDALRYGATFGDGKPVVVALGDSIIRNPTITRRLIDAYTGNVVAAIGVETVPDAAVNRYGIVVGEERDGMIEVDQVLEKPSPDQVPSRLAVAARYVLGPEVFGALRETQPDASGEVQVADALNRVIAAGGGRVIALPLAEGERRHDIGTVDSYCAAFLEYALAEPRIGPALRAQLG